MFLRPRERLTGAQPHEEAPDVSPPPLGVRHQSFGSIGCIPHTCSFERMNKSSIMILSSQRRCNSILRQSID